MAEIGVRYEDGDRFTLGIRGHEVIVDQPVADGGTDQGATPTELFVGGLASCVAFYAGRFFLRHGVEREGLAVACAFEMAEDRPNRVRSIDIRLNLPVSFPPDLQDRLMAVVEHCTVHNSMVQMPDVLITAGGAIAAA